MAAPIAKRTARLLRQPLAAPAGVKIAPKAFVFPTRATAAHSITATRAGLGLAGMAQDALGKAPVDGHVSDASKVNMAELVWVTPTPCLVATAHDRLLGPLVYV
jgi:hypothetical protein